MVNATKPGLDILHSCNVPTSHWIWDIEFESVSALKISHAQFDVLCIYATVVFGNEGPAFTLHTLSLKRFRGVHLVQKK